MKTLFKVRVLLPLIGLSIAIGIGAMLFLEQDPLPDWGTLTTVDGKKLNVNDIRGKVVMINFWATSCSSCVAEMPQFKKLYLDYKDKGFELVALAMPYDQTPLVEKFQQSAELPFPVVHDSKGTLIPRFGRVVVTPTTMLYDKNRIKKYSWIGPMADAKLRATIDALIAP